MFGLNLFQNENKKNLVGCHLLKRTIGSLWKKVFGDGPDTGNSDAPVDLDDFRTQFLEFQPLIPEIIEFLSIVTLPYRFILSRELVDAQPIFTELRVVKMTPEKGDAVLNAIYGALGVASICKDSVSDFLFI